MSNAIHPFAGLDRLLAFDPAPLESLLASIAESAVHKLDAERQLELLNAELRARPEMSLATCAELAKVVQLFLQAMQGRARSEN